MTFNTKTPISCKTALLTSKQFIDLLPTIELLTDGLIFIGSISNVILTSQWLLGLLEQICYPQPVASDNRLCKTFSQRLISMTFCSFYRSVIFTTTLLHFIYLSNIFMSVGCNVKLCPVSRITTALARKRLFPWI